MSEKEYLDEISAQEQETLMEQDLLDTDAVAEPEETEQETLMEQDLLDTDAEVETEQEVIELEMPSAEELCQVVKEKDALIKKNDKIIMGMLWAIGVLTILLTFCVGVIAGQHRQIRNSEEFVGLKVGDKYDKYLTLGDYTGLTYTDPYAEPTDAEILEKMQTEIIIPITQELQNGDAAILNFEGFVDGERYENACSEKYELNLGSGTFIPGFEEGLLGHKAGDSVTLNLTFPEDYSEELAGKDVRFEVEIVSATRKLPDLASLTDEIVATATEEEFTDAATYTKYIRAQLAEEKREKADNTIKNDLWKQIKENSTLKDYPQNLYNYYEEELDERFSTYYSSYGVSDLDGLMEKAFSTTTAEYIEDQIFYDYAVYTIAGMQKMNVSEEDMNAYAKTYSYENYEELLKATKMEKWELENAILYERVTDFIVENAVAE